MCTSCTNDINQLAANFSQHNSKQCCHFDSLERFFNYEWLSLTIFKNFALKETLQAYNYHQGSFHTFTCIHYMVHNSQVTLFSLIFGSMCTLHFLLFSSKVNFNFHFILVGWLILWGIGEAQLIRRCFLFFQPSRFLPCSLQLLHQYLIATTVQFSNFFCSIMVTRAKQTTMIVDITLGKS